MRRFRQHVFLWIYRVVFANGLLRFRFGRRAFFSLYSAYKPLFETGPIAKLQTYVPAGSLVIDVGTNVGFFNAAFCKMDRT